MQDLRWQQRAECRASGNDTFFPAESGRTLHDLEVTKIAKAECGRCEVREKCLIWALENEINSGIWGGYTTRERRALAKKKKRGQPLRVA